MSFVAVAIGGGALLSGVAGIAGAKMSGDAAKDAAVLQAQAAERATALQEKQYNQTRADNEPWRQAGITALGGMQDKDYMRDFTSADMIKDPGYEFRMSEGQKALDRSASARGGILSGGALKSISRYGQDFASNELQNAYNRFNGDRDRRFGRLSSLAGLGGGANAANSAAGANYANNAGSNMMGAAEGAGNSRMAGANAWGGALSNIGKSAMDAGAMYQQSNWMDRMLKAQQGGLSGTKMAGQSYSNLSGIA